VGARAKDNQFLLHVKYFDVSCARDFRALGITIQLTSRGGLRGKLLTPKKLTLLRTPPRDQHPPPPGMFIGRQITFVLIVKFGNGVSFKQTDPLSKTFPAYELVEAWKFCFCRYLQTKRLIVPQF
jgi:hypothetical protein